MRYNRVELILDQEPAFKARMGPKTEVVLKPDGEKQLFSPEVIAVTQAIHTAGKDAHKVQKTEIIKAAVKVFQIGAANRATTPAPAAPTPAAPEPPAAPAPPAPPTPAPVAPVAASKAVSKAAPKAPARAKAAPEVVVPAPKKTEPVSEAPAPRAEVESSKDGPPNLDRPQGENTAAYNAYISMYSLSLTTLQLVELYDNQPGKEETLKYLDWLAKRFNKYTSIKSAKESQKA